jgi:hypothetical protein
MRLPRSLPALLLAACAPAAADAPPLDVAAYERSLAEWKTGRLAEAAGPDGWSTLTALHWLNEGDSRVGGDSAAEVSLPRAHAPRRVGTIRFAQGRALFVAERGARVTNGDAPVDSVVLGADTAGRPTVLSLGSVSMRLIKRGDRVGVRVKDTLSDRRVHFAGLQYFPTDTAWRLHGRLIPYPKGKTLRIMNVLGMEDDQPSPGAVEFVIGGKTYRLDTIVERGDTDLFVMFRDRTSVDETYPAGRFLHVNNPDAEGRVVIDFNRAYNPPCAFSPFATCPLPPRQNVLPIRIPAGERRYAGEHATG